MFNITGIIIAVIALFSIGLGHVWVPFIYRLWGLKSWYLVLVLGVLFAVVSVFIQNVILSAMLAVFAASFLWGIKELVEMDKKRK